MGVDRDPRGLRDQIRTWLSEHRSAATVVGALAAASLVLWGALVGTGSPIFRASTDVDATGTQDDQPPAPSANEAAPEPELEVPEEPEDAETEAPEPDEPLDPEEHAPLDPSDPGERWIVVVASYTSPAAAERDARTRAEEGGDEPRLLWSSHYPSLTPELWVVFEGPYPDRGAAVAAAEVLGGDAYVRELTGESDA